MSGFIHNTLFNHDICAGIDTWIGSMKSSICSLCDNIWDCYFKDHCPILYPCSQAFTTPSFDFLWYVLQMFKN